MNYSSFSHLGITVPDLEAAIIFYTNVFGCKKINENKIVNDGISSPTLERLKKVFKEKWDYVKVAHLLTIDNIGIELFEFSIVEPPKNNFDYFKTGVSHFCIENSNPEELIKKIIKYGGKQRTSILKHKPDTKPYRMVFCEDPFGNVFEIYSHSYHLINKK